MASSTWWRRNTVIHRNAIGTPEFTNKYTKDSLLGKRFGHVVPSHRASSKHLKYSHYKFLIKYNFKAKFHVEGKAFV